MKAHKIELKTVPSIDLTTDKEIPTGFDYRYGVRLAMAAGGERGMSGDDVCKAAELIPELKAAKNVFFVSPENHAWLVRRVHGVMFINATTGAAQFIKDVKEAPLVDIDAEGKEIEPKDKRKEAA